MAEERRFRVPEIPAGDTIFISDRAQFHRIKNVLRMKAGGCITVFDGSGTEATGEIIRLDAQSAVVAIRSRTTKTPRPVEITIACAVSRKGMDEIVDKLTQLGVDAIIPMTTERVVPKLDDESSQAKLSRWRRLADAASEQSKRSRTPDVRPVTPFREMVSGSGSYDLKLIPHLLGERTPLRDLDRIRQARKILVAIGPEGDFAPEEIEVAVKAGFVPVSLGQTVLRVDTAAIAVAAYLRLALGL